MDKLRQMLRREVLSLYGMIFMADVVSGLIFPTFSLYARSLGASLTLIGALSGIMGLTNILVSVPIGMLSDTKGRKNVLTVGMLLFAGSSLLYTVAPNPYYLFPIRVVAALAMVSTFFMGVPYLGDVVAKEQRGLAIGLYTTAMGLGFTVGPALGGYLSAGYGYRASYQAAAACALIGFAIGRLGLAGPTQGSQAAAGHPRAWTWMFSRMSLVLRDPNLLAASLANLVNGTVFSGAISNFFSLYMASLSVGDAAIGSMFAVRAFVSSMVRLPTGLLTTRLPTRGLMVSALVLAMAACLSISLTGSPAVLGALLAGEGIAFGMFLTSGQAFVAEHARESDRGVAMGVYSTAGSIGSASGPFALGIVADLWGLTAVFRATAFLVLVGIGLFAYMSLWKPPHPAPETSQP